MVTDVKMGSFGSLYLEAVAGNEQPVLDALEAFGDERPTRLVEPRVFFPEGNAHSVITLDSLVGEISGKKTEAECLMPSISVVKEGHLNEAFGGLRLTRVAKVELESKRAFIEISDAGFLGVLPLQLELTRPCAALRSVHLTRLRGSTQPLGWLFPAVLITP